MRKVFRVSIFLLLTALLLPAAVSHAQNTTVCKPEDKPCLMSAVEALAPSIDTPGWRDQTYRELAKAYTYNGEEGKAVALLPKITAPDTKAMTIRGIGMAAAKGKWPKERYDALFKTLTLESAKIDHLPSRGIAETYIAMAQAFAGDDAGAFQTAKAMKNDALRHKAFGESAEIQAEHGRTASVFASLAAIDSVSFRNKAYGIVSKIFLTKGDVQSAYDCAQKIDNAYLKAQALQTIINHGNPDEEEIAVPHAP